MHKPYAKQPKCPANELSGPAPADDPRRQCGSHQKTRWLSRIPSSPEIAAILDPEVPGSGIRSKLAALTETELAQCLLIGQFEKLRLIHEEYARRTGEVQGPNKELLAALALMREWDHLCSQCTPVRNRVKGWLQVRKGL